MKGRRGGRRGQCVRQVVTGGKKALEFGSERPLRHPFGIQALPDELDLSRIELGGGNRQHEILE